MTKEQETRPALVDVTALRVNQFEQTLYLFSLNASTIHKLITSDKLGVDRWTPETPEGYQRLPVDSRYKRFGRFVAKQKGISPTSVLISLRNRNALQVQTVSGSDTAVNLKINDIGEKLYTPDGQHRAYGLDWAVKTFPGEVEDFEVPIVLFVTDGRNPRYEEAQQFYLINNNSKKTKTDLAQRYVLRERELGSGNITRDITMPSGNSKILLPYAVKISDMLNAEGPLKDMIILPNAQNSHGSISQNSFIDSIKPLITKASEAHWTIGETTNIISAFWNAVKLKCPKAFSHWAGDSCAEEDRRHFNAVLVKTSGMYILNDVLSRSMFLAAVAKARTAPETYTELLNNKEVEKYFDDDRTGYWSSESGVEGAASHGTSRKSFKEVADEIWEELVQNQNS